MTLIYFAYAFLMTIWFGNPAPQIAAACALPIALALGANWESRHSAPWSRVLRDWLPLLLILAAYWELQWFATDPSTEWETRFQGWDTWLVGSFPSWPAAIGVFCTGAIQFSYALLYALPVIYLGAIYALGTRVRAHAYLFTLFLGTFSAYLILPHIPVRSPRIAFPALLLPGVVTIFGKWNLWILDRLDISTSVFPSGHVAVAFSAAFGLMRALPERRLIWAVAFALAVCVWAATIYSRYHYSADGAASLLICIVAWRFSGRWDPLDREV